MISKIIYNIAGTQHIYPSVGGVFSILGEIAAKQKDLVLLNCNITCRDSLAYYWSNIESLKERKYELTKIALWFPDTCNIEKLNAFITIAENMIAGDNANHVLKKYPTRFHKTQNKNVVVISVPLFWRESHLRRSLFSFLVRMGVYSCAFNNGFSLKDGDDENNKNFLNFLKTNDYSKGIFLSVEYFLKGNTKIMLPEINIEKEYTRGWKHFFGGKTSEELKKLLQKP